MTIGPIDITSEIPEGCICDRKCWDEFLEFYKKYSKSYSTMWRCAKHGVRHEFQPGSAVIHLDCTLKESSTEKL